MLKTKRFIKFLLTLLIHTVHVSNTLIHFHTKYLTHTHLINSLTYSLHTLFIRLKYPTYTHVSQYIHSFTGLIQYTLVLHV